jgi:hypothetical protein
MQNKLFSCAEYSYVRKATFIVKVHLQIFFTIFLVTFTVIEAGMDTLSSHNLSKPQSAQCITAVYQKSATQVPDTEVLYPFRSVPFRHLTSL